jgi:proline dehydrogenase
VVSGTQLMEKILFGVAKQWVAGNTIDDALCVAQKSYKNGMSVIINRLGEYHTSSNIIQKTVDEYVTVMSSFRKWRVGGAISVKPTQVGLSKSVKECRRNFEYLIREALKSHTFVWIDMESSDHTDNTIETYLSLFTRYERIGLALQANLRRTESDLVSLLSVGAKLRLVKGAYREDGRTAYKTREQVDESFGRLMRKLFESGNEFGIATHDCKMVETAKSLSRKYQRHFEFQMLRGIRDELKRDLVREKFAVAEYIPYGTNWLPYSIRRLRERKRNILLLGSSFVSQYRR